MAGGQIHLVLQQLRRLIAAPAAAAESNADLLRRFTEQRDEAAFTALLRRYGALVLGVCRRVLGNAHDADDAFQATFLVLAQKARSIRNHAALGSWLYGVAYRVARAARTRAARRRAHERGEGEMHQTHPATPATDPAAVAARRELQLLLDDELNGLPAHYRTSLVLCYFEGKTSAEAARQLGCPQGTVLARLARGRELLRGRLVRRGLALPAAALVAELERPALAAVPAAMAEATVRSALQVIAGSIPAEACPQAVALARATLKAMTMTKLKIAAAVVLVVGSLAVGTGLLIARAAPAEPVPVAAADQPADPPRAEDPAEPLPPGAVRRLGSNRFKYGDWVHQLAFTADGRGILSGAWGQPRLWETATGKELRAFGGRRQEIRGFVLSPDGKHLAGWERTYDRAKGPLQPAGNVLHLWEVSTGKEIGSFPGPNQDLIPTVFSPDGRLLATLAGEQVISMREVATGRELNRLKGPATYPLAFSPDGETLAVSDSRANQLVFWDVAKGEKARQIPVSIDWDSPFAFTPDGKSLLAKAGGPKGALRLLDAATGKELHRFPVPGKFRPKMPSLFLTADGSRLLAPRADLKAVHVWDLGKGEELHQLMVAAPIETLVVAPDGKRAATYSPAPVNVLQVWDVAAGKRLWSASLELGQSSGAVLAFSPDGKALASGFRGIIRLRDVETGREIGPGGDAQGLATSGPDGPLAASARGDGTIVVADRMTGKEIHRLEGHRGGVLSLAFTADQRVLASAGGGDETVRFWDVATGKELRRFSRLAYGLILAPDGKTLLTADSAGQLLLDATTGKELHRFPGGVYTTFSPDGQLLASFVIERAAAGDEQKQSTLAVRLWRVASGKEAGRWVGGQQNPLAFSPNGRMLAKGSRALDGSCTIHFMELATVSERLRLGMKLDRPSGMLQPLAFTPDSRLLAQGDDNDIRLWDLATGQELARLEGHRGFVSHVAFAADGRTLTSVSADTTLVWDVLAPRKKAALPGLRLSPAELEACWADLAGGDAVKAHQALWQLVGDPERCVPLFQKGLAPVPVIGADKLRQFVKDMESDQFAVRQKAAEELEKLGDVAEATLRAAAQSGPSLELSRRLQEVLAKLDGPPAPSPDRLRLLRGIEALEHIGTAEARQVLQKLAEGQPGAAPTRNAQGALERLGQRSAP
jgi:RNA polymerase sigma factor (sigma-70 family)